jgi:hypothetical protein
MLNMCLWNLNTKATLEIWKAKNLNTLFFSFTKLVKLCLKKTNMFFFYWKYMFFCNLLSKKTSQNSKSLPPNKSLLIIKIQLETEKPDFSKKICHFVNWFYCPIWLHFHLHTRFHFCPTPTPPPRPHLPTNHISPHQPTYVLPTPLLPAYLPSG